MVDYHVHSTFSDGEKPVSALIELAEKLGIERIAITDHYDPFDPSLGKRRKTDEELFAHFEEIRSCARNKKVEVICGIETCTGMNGELRVSGACQEACSLIITSPHYVEGGFYFDKGQYFNDAYWGAYKRKLLNMASGPGDVLGHPMGYLPIGPMLGDGTTYESRQEICRGICSRYFDREFIAELGARLAASGKACELHGATGTPDENTVRLLHAQGVRFSVGSDAHAVNILGKNERAMELVQRLGLKTIWA